MMLFLLVTTFAIGLSESIEQRLPEDPNTVYAVGFEYQGVWVDLDWQNREIVPAGVCRQVTSEEQPRCQQVAIQWMRAECAWYSEKAVLSVKQEDMQYAVCLGADAVSDMVLSRQLADR